MIRYSLFKNSTNHFKTDEQIFENQILFWWWWILTISKKTHFYYFNTYFLINYFLLFRSSKTFFKITQKNCIFKLICKAGIKCHPRPRKRLTLTLLLLKQKKSLNTISCRFEGARFAKIISFNLIIF